MENWVLILQVLKVSSLDNNFLWHFLIDKMFSQDRQMIVDGFRHQHFWIWTIFDCVMTILVAIELIRSFSAFRVVLLIILIKSHINQPKVVQIQKCWCLNLPTTICLSCEDILTIKKCHGKLLSSKGTFETFKVRPQFSIENA